MAKEETKKAPKTAWVKPSSKAEVEKLILKNLEGFCVKGARVEHKGYYPTGHFNLDFAISQGTLPINVDISTIKGFNPVEPGGAPRGRLIEVYGEPGGGKSSLCLRITGNAQKQGKTCVWIDREQSFVESLAVINGVDLDSLFMMANPAVSAEECFDHIYQLLENGVDLIVVDSVSGLIPKSVLEGTDSTKDTVALLARVMGKCVPKLAAKCALTNGTVIFINQIRQKPGVMFGDPTTTPGGDTLKFYASLRLQITKRYGADAETYREDENGQQQLIAQDSYAYVRKNRFAKNLKNGIPIPIYFEPFFPNAEEVAFDLGRQLQVVKKRNEFFYWKTGPTSKIEGDGRKAFIEKLMEQQQLPTLIAELKAEAKEQGVVLPPELMNFEVLGAGKTKKKAAVQSKESQIIEEYLETEAKDAQDMDIDVAADVLLGEPAPKWDSKKPHNDPENIEAAVNAILTDEKSKTDETDVSRSRKKKTGKAG